VAGVVVGFGVGFGVGFMVVVALADVTDTAMDAAIERPTHNANDRREKQN
jgi:Flp pilus assembly protein TadG